MSEPIWLTRAMVEALHAAQVREHGGQLGLRDEGLLESALARPRNASSYQPDADLPLLAAEYGYGLAKNHAFLDGNKRIAFVAMNVFLILDGHEIDAPEPEVVERMLEVAEGRLPLEGLGEWIRQVLVPVQNI